jgi:hypothetical protein
LLCPLLLLFLLSPQPPCLTCQHPGRYDKIVLSSLHIYGSIVFYYQNWRKICAYGTVNWIPFHICDFIFNFQLSLNILNKISVIIPLRPWFVSANNNHYYTLAAISSWTHNVLLHVSVTYILIASFAYLPCFFCIRHCTSVVGNLVMEASTCFLMTNLFNYIMFSA